MAIALYKLASAAEYRVVATTFGSSQNVSSQMSSFVSLMRRYLLVLVELRLMSLNFRFCHALCRKIDQFVYLPGPGEAQDIANENFMKTGFPQVYGAIDGCHIHIKPPQTGASDYINRKRYPSIVLQGVVDNRYRLVYTCTQP